MDLFELTRQCAVRLATSSGHGTGFFVAPRHLLTCAHVVRPALTAGTAITMNWQGQSYPVEVLDCRDDSDLALLRVEVANHPCVLLHPGLTPNNDLWSYGYPDNYSDGGAPTSFKAEGSFGDQEEYIKFKQGQVRPGMSGSPLLNEDTGGICGVVEYTRDRGSDLGGDAIATKLVLQQFPDLLAMQAGFHQHDARWLDLLTRQQRQALGILDAPGVGREQVKGRGTMVGRGLLSPLPSSAYEVFISYAPKDQKLETELEKYLSLLQQDGLISAWNTQMIEPGAVTTDVINAHLQTARIILLLISADFVALKYRDGADIQQALARHNEGSARVIPVLLRPTDWESAPFGKLEPLPKNKRPVILWKPRDEAFTEIARGLRAVVENMRKQDSNI